jgi:pyrroline-5-carboxylate reductase
MREKTMGFIGGGRVVRIILQGLKNKGKLPRQTIISDTNGDVLERLKVDFPGIQVFINNNGQAAGQDLVFLALHPPTVEEALKGVKNFLRQDAMLISLAPKLTIRRLSEVLGGFNRIIRMIPNAPSYLNAGYNPIAFSSSLTPGEKKEFLDVISVLGLTPEIDEEKLEAYALLSAMGPTYFWFQMDELVKIGTTFGLDTNESRRAVSEMLKGAITCMFDSGLPAEKVMDLIPVKPLQDIEEQIKSNYRSRLRAVYEKIRAIA